MNYTPPAPPPPAIVEMAPLFATPSIPLPPGPYHIQIQALACLPTPPNPVIVTGWVQELGMAGVRISDGTGYVWVRGLPDDIRIGVTATVRGNAAGDTMVAAWFQLVDRGTSWSWTREGVPEPPTPPPVVLTSSPAGVKGNVSFVVRPLVFGASAAWEAGGESYRTTVEVIGWVVDTERVRLDFTRGNAWGAEYSRVPQMEQ